jgi:cadmium resistance protein CadD (predicted permease)
VPPLAPRIAAAIGMFVGTNVDDLVVLTVLFLGYRASGRPKPWQIWLGQHLGISALIALSAIAALGLTIVPDRWVGLLGLLPLAMGARGLFAAVRHARSDATDDDDPPPMATGVVSVAAITIANGADNVSVYTPTFRAIGLAQSLVTVAVFAAMTALWCAAGAWLGSRERVIAVAKRYGRWIVPVVFVLIGAGIVAESGVAGRALSAARAHAAAPATP